MSTLAIVGYIALALVVLGALYLAIKHGLIGDFFGAIFSVLAAIFSGGSGGGGSSGSSGGGFGGGSSGGGGSSDDY